MRLTRIAFFAGLILARASGQSTCINFPAGLIPFSSISYVTAANSAGDHLVANSGAEIYDPATGAFVQAAPMAFNRNYHTATLMKDGRVLLGRTSMDIMWFCRNLIGSVVWVQDGIKKHVGIVYDAGWDFSNRQPYILIADNNPGRGRAGLASFAEFAAGRTLQFGRMIQTGTQESRTILANVDALIAEERAYDLLKFNCEHFVTAAFGTTPNSEQVESLGTLLTLGPRGPAVVTWPGSRVRSPCRCDVAR